MKKAILFIVMLLTIGIVSTGLCQIRPGTQSITPYVGGYTFDGNLDLDTNPVYGLKLGYDFARHFGAELVLGYIATRYVASAKEIKTSVFNERIEGLYYFMPDKRLVPYVAAGIGVQLTNYRKDILDKARFVADYGVGIKYFWTDSIVLRADVRHVLAFGSIYNNLEYTLGLGFVFGGVKPTPVAAVYQSEPPPPPPPSQPVPGPAPREPLAKPLGLSTVALSDSQINLNWNCVQGATGYKVHRDNAYAFPSKGCSATDKGLNADTRYCYQVASTDDENRESALSNQDCARTSAAPVMEMKKPAEAAPVMEMKKPAEAAPVVTQKVTKEAAAAAAVAKEIVEKGRATINVQFDTGKAIIKPKYNAELQKFATVLKDNPNLKIIIEGHTDDVGKDESNMKLSQARAESVRKYLIIKLGVEEGRLTAKGYGEMRPIYDNRVAVGRAKNRRVEAVADYVIKK